MALREVAGVRASAADVRGELADRRLVLIGRDLIAALAALRRSDFYARWKENLALAVIELHAGMDEFLASAAERPGWA
jgi:hypothetical protein